VVAANFPRVGRIGARDIGVADDGDVITKSFQRLQAGGRQVELTTRRGRRPEIFGLKIRN
jgi:hypothetical protein